jgi:hypothetical protein
MLTIIRSLFNTIIRSLLNREYNLMNVLKALASIVSICSDYDIYNIVADDEVGVGCDRARSVTCQQTVTSIRTWASVSHVEFPHIAPTREYMLICKMCREVNVATGKCGCG